MKIRLANKNDLEEILDIIRKRISWFKDNNIDQWQQGYLEYFNEEYFGKLISKNELYIVIINKDTAGIFALFNTDSELWKNGDDNTSLYIHHLTTKENYKGLGSNIINYIEGIAIDLGKQFVRLDCMNSNDKLNKYYNKLGFKKVGVFKESEYYTATLREKKLMYK